MRIGLNYLFFLYGGRGWGNPNLFRKCSINTQWKQRIIVNSERKVTCKYNDLIVKIGKINIFNWTCSDNRFVFILLHLHLCCTWQLFSNDSNNQKEKKKKIKENQLWLNTENFELCTESNITTHKNQRTLLMKMKREYRQK